VSTLAVIHDTVLKLDPRLLQLGSGILIPLVVGWLTHLHASSKLKAILNFVLSAIAGGLSVALATNGTVVLSTFITSIVTYYGLWKPTGWAASVQQTGLDLGAPPAPTSVGRDDILPGPGPVDPEVAAPADAELPPKSTTRSTKSVPRKR
jgi:hypothetical protein